MKQQEKRLLINKKANLWKSLVIKICRKKLMGSKYWYPFLLGRADVVIARAGETKEVESSRLKIRICCICRLRTHKKGLKSRLLPDHPRLLPENLLRSQFMKSNITIMRFFFPDRNHNAILIEKLSMHNCLIDWKELRETAPLFALS